MWVRLNATFGANVVRVHTTLTNEVLLDLSGIVNRYPVGKYVELYEIRSKYDRPVEQFLNADPDTLNSNMRIAYAAYKYHSFIHGLDSSQQRILEAYQRGMKLNIATIAAIQVSRRYGDFDSSVKYVKRLFEASSGAVFPGYYLAECYFSVAQIEELTHHAALTFTMNRDALRRDQRLLRQWVVLLVSAGLHQIADRFVELLEDNAVRLMFEGRLSTFEQSWDVPVTMVNLSREPRKARVSSGSLARAGYENFTIHEGVPGYSLPSDVIERLTAPGVQERYGLGAVGCWLSHWAVWQRVAESGEEWTLVVEDDAVPVCGASFLRDATKTFPRQDFIWANERMSGNMLDRRSSFDRHGLGVWEQLATWPSGQKGVGADGYLLSARGAEKLLTLCEGTVISQHVDLFLATVTAEQVGEPVTPIQQQVTQLRRNGIPQALSAVCLSTPGLKAFDFGHSSTVTAQRDLA